MMSWAAPLKARLAARLAAGIEELGLVLPSGVTQATFIDTQLAFLALLQRWNQAYALTAIRDPIDMVDKHILDSLSIAPYLLGDQVLDVGTGPGLPGIPLAILMPQCQFTLLDSQAKKVRFLTQVRLQLPLANIEPVCVRVEEYKEATAYSCILSRAMADTATLIAKTRHLCAPSGQWVLMKGHCPDGPLPAQAAVQALQVPGVQGARHVVLVPF